VGAAAVLGLIFPSAGIASEPTAHNGTGSLKYPPAAAPAGDPTARHTIPFDPGTAPCTFSETAPLTHEYHGTMGVEFMGPGEGQGGAILNQCGGFGVDARSGEEFLAFSTITYAIPPEHILFDNLQRTVTLYVANGFGGGTATFKLKALKDGQVVARKSITTAETGWLRMRVADGSGIDEVILNGTTGDGAFVVDDLKFRDL
jgi:hypothetical protein